MVGIWVIRPGLIRVIEIQGMTRIPFVRFIEMEMGTITMILVMDGKIGTMWQEPILLRQVQSL